MLSLQRVRTRIQSMKSHKKEREGWKRSLEEELGDEDNGGRGRSGQRERESCSYICSLLV